MISIRLMLAFVSALAATSLLPAQATFGPAQITPGPTGIGSFRPDLDVGDWTGDCFPDVIWAESDLPNSRFVTWVNDGLGGFPNYTLHANEINPASVRLADVDGDGDQDVITGTNGGSVLILPNVNGSIGFFTPDFVAALGFKPLRRLEVADLDMDGDIDFVVGPAAPGGPDHLCVFINSGSGTFVCSDMLFPALGPAPSNDAINDLKLEDLDGDGLPEVIIAHETGVGYPFNSSVSIYQNQGSGSFDGGTVVFDGTSSNLVAWGVAAVDINNTGGIDLLVFTEQEIYRIYNGGMVPFSIQIPITQGNYQIQARHGVARDLDQDGDVEILHWGGNGLGLPLGSNTFEVGLHDGTGFGNFGFQAFFETDTGSGCHIADLNLDGWDDLLWFRNPDHSDITVRLNTTGGPTPFAGLRGLSTSVNGGGYDGTDKSFTAGDTVAIGLDDSCIFDVTGRPGTLFLNFPPESALTATTPLGGGVTFPGLTLVTPFSTPSGPVAVVADALGFIGPGITNLGAGPIAMGDSPITFTAPANPPGTVFRFQGTYFHPIPAYFSTFGLVATNELRLTAF